MNTFRETLHVAVVEDNDTLRDLLVSYLDRPGRRVFAADCGEALNQVLAQHPLDIVVLDINLPYEDGLSITRRLRASHPQTKVVMLTARVRAADRTEGYDAGADVYLTKPTNMAELDAVVRNLAGRRGANAPLAGFVLNRQAQVLTSPQRKQVVLSTAECLILVQLALAPAEGMDAEALLERLREQQGNAQLSRDNLMVAVSRLRFKVEVQLDAAQLIQTVRNFGYRLSQAVVLE